MKELLQEALEALEDTTNRPLNGLNKSIIELTRAIKLKLELEENFINSRWHTDDVICRASDRDLEVTGEQAKNILNSVERYYDANIGINWDDIDYHTDEELNN